MRNRPGGHAAGQVCPVILAGQLLTPALAEPMTTVPIARPVRYTAWTVMPLAVLTCRLRTSVPPGSEIV